MEQSSTNSSVTMQYEQPFERAMQALVPVISDSDYEVTEIDDGKGLISFRTKFTYLPFSKRDLAVQVERDGESSVKIKVSGAIGKVDGGSEAGRPPGIKLAAAEIYWGLDRELGCGRLVSGELTPPRKGLGGFIAGGLLLLATLSAFAFYAGRF